ncbi:MAG: metallophosphoesterase family protein, partial [Pseudobutyrivibrio sp.]|nr:metallophosphoesterase family protein [Pseudobutyrivibrio sp.]
MKILVVSDSHGRSENFRDAIRIENPDRIYHLGDGQGVEDNLWMMSEAPAECVCGNCDWGTSLPSEVVLEVGKHVILLTHGH